MVCRHFMLDIETLGFESDSIVLSIACVEFDKSGPIGEPFYKTLQAHEQLENGRTMSLHTIEWWMDFGASYPKRGRVPTVEALWALQLFLPPDHMMWAMPTTFDLRVLGDLYTMYETSIPWHRHNVRDVYTIADALTKEERDAIRAENKEAHNAVADCINQIKLVTESWKRHV